MTHTPRRRCSRVLALLLVPGCVAPITQARASGYAFCELTGVVRGVEATDTRRRFSIDLEIVAASPLVRDGVSSYSDCSDRVGKAERVEMTLTRRAGAPANGDRIRFRWSAVDGFGASGDYVGTSIDVRFVSIERAATTAE